MKPKCNEPLALSNDAFKCKARRPCDKGLEELLDARKHRLDGVVNGIDIDEWNSADDKFCAVGLGRECSKYPSTRFKPSFLELHTNL